jgi:hypothetical protein
MQGMNHFKGIRHGIRTATCHHPDLPLLWGAQGRSRPGSPRGIGIVILVFGFKLPPGKPPVDVMLTIIAVVAASATLQASGGLE